MNALKPKRKYYYYAIEYSIGCEGNGSDYFVPEWAQYSIIRAMTEHNAEMHLCERDGFDSWSRNHYVGRIQQCASLEEAHDIIDNWAREREPK